MSGLTLCAKKSRCYTIGKPRNEIYSFPFVASKLLASHILSHFAELVFFPYESSSTKAYAITMRIELQNDGIPMYTYIKFGLSTSLSDP